MALTNTQRKPTDGKNAAGIYRQTTIYTLHDRGWSRRRIARELGIDRETVGRYLWLAKPAIATARFEEAREVRTRFHPQDPTAALLPWPSSTKPKSSWSSSPGWQRCEVKPFPEIRSEAQGMLLGYIETSTTQSAFIRALGYVSAGRPVIEPIFSLRRNLLHMLRML
jgi:hypothetical protein